MSSLRSSGGIFISYRREETAAYAGRLYDRLTDRFSEDRVFMDVDSIAIGVDFARAVVDAVTGCDILLALIGRNWSTITDDKGKRRIDNPDDFVRIEIETALKRDIRVVPVLIDGAALPQANDLPQSLRPLIRRQALELSHASFRSEVTRLVAAVAEVVEDASSRPARTPESPFQEKQQSSPLKGTQQGSRWTTELLTSTAGTRSLRVKLDSTHILTVRLRPWSDTVQVDNKVVLRRNPLKGSHRFDIDDGGRQVAAEISIEQTEFSQRITKLSLIVMGQRLYAE